MRKKEFFGKRVISVYVFLIIAMFGALLRIFKISSDEKVKASAANNCYRIELSDMRKTIFDCNMNPITNTTERIMAVVYPVPRAITAVSSLLSKEQFEDLKERLSAGMPAAVELPQKTECDGVYCFSLKKYQTENTACPQLIGYLDSSSHGVMGIEKSFDKILYHDSVTALVSTDSLGKLLLGAQTELSCDLNDYNSGIMLTIDSSLQAVTENAMKDIKSGAAVVSEVGTGKIRAMVSLPDFDANNISAYLKNEDSPFLNRTLSAYNVGSVFKPVVAAALLEQGEYTDFSFYCSGSTNIDGHTFGCHKSSGHGLMDLKNALTQSCNVFFYNVSQNVGSDAILKMASVFRLGSSLNLGEIYSNPGVLPNFSDKLAKTDLANLSIGQGTLLLSPVSLVSVYEAIANGGIYHSPYVVEGEVKNGVINPYKTSAPTRAFSEKTAETLKEYLKNVVLSGTGSVAAPSNTTAAGKTATAQTGINKNGKLIENSWFCGFFPADNPKYVVTVMIDDTEKNGTFGAPIFKKIAEGITLFEKSKNNATK